jgi:hypothetical protein
MMLLSISGMVQQRLGADRKVGVATQGLTEDSDGWSAGQININRSLSFYPPLRVNIPKHSEFLPVFHYPPCFEPTKY